MHLFRQEIWGNIWKHTLVYQNKLNLYLTDGICLYIWHSVRQRTPHIPTHKDQWAVSRYLERFPAWLQELGFWIFLSDTFQMIVWCGAKSTTMDIGGSFVLAVIRYLWKESLMQCQEPLYLMVIRYSWYSWSWIFEWGGFIPLILVLDSLDI